jgi:hypothetical protein
MKKKERRRFFVLCCVVKRECEMKKVRKWKQIENGKRKREPNRKW